MLVCRPRSSCRDEQSRVPNIKGGLQYRTSAAFASGPWRHGILQLHVDVDQVHTFSRSAGSLPHVQMYQQEMS